MSDSNFDRTLIWPDVPFERENQGAESQRGVHGSNSFKRTRESTVRWSVPNSRPFAATQPGYSFSTMIDVQRVTGTYKTKRATRPTTARK